MPFMESEPWYHTLDDVEETALGRARGVPCAVRRLVADVRADGRRPTAAAVRSRPLGAGPLPHLTVLVGVVVPADWAVPGLVVVHRPIDVCHGPQSPHISGVN